MMQFTQSTLAALETAYRQTLYEVVSDTGVIPLRVNVKSVALDRLLQQYQQTTWGLITAWNPYSRLLSELENRNRNRALAVVLRKLGLSFLPAVGRDEFGQWPAEESLFVVGLNRADALSIGQKFSQNAILYGQIGNSPELLWPFIEGAKTAEQGEQGKQGE